MLLHKLRRNKHGFSTVIAVVLSLVILVVIVANVVLWNYTMSQVDWERTKEDIRIVNATHVTNSSWSTAQAEYTVNLGRRLSGSYTDTKQVGGSYETFAEDTVIQKSYLRRTDLSGVTPVGKVMNATQPPLGQTETSYVIARAASVYFYTPSLQAGSVASGTWTLYLWSSTESSGKTSQLTVQISVVSSDGSVVKATIGTVANIVVGYGFSERAISVSGIAATITSGDRICLTLNAQAGAGNDSQGMRFYYDGYGTYETQGHETRLLQPSGAYRLDLNGPFSIDLSTYPLSVIKSVEVQMVYRANDTYERWYLKAYNWTAASYSDFSFNTTAGHVPTLTWSTYAVNITRWRSYLDANGALSIKLQDNLADSNQTRIDLDFLGIRVVVRGTVFTFQNKGAVTLHLVSLWINNSTRHNRYDVDLFINAGDTLTYVRSDINLPSKAVVKVVTARGNVAIYSAN
jgi:hypothetical protein